MNPRSKFQFTPLSGLQIKILCTLAGQAFKAAKLRRAIDDTMTVEEYRREGQLEACGMASLKDCDQSHFLQIRAKWFVVIGNLEEAFNDLLNGTAEAEATRQMRRRLVGQIAGLADAIGEKHERETGIVLEVADRAARARAYAEGIAFDQMGTRNLLALTSQKLEWLGFTVTNRATAMRGKGNPENRNKSQRRKSKEPGTGEVLRQRPAEGSSFMERARQRLAGSTTSGGPESGLNRL
ncbi:MAG: hypothetical protein V4662_17880 [Verrucomicrobiota bacterium]